MSNQLPSTVPGPASPVPDRPAGSAPLSNAYLQAVVSDLRGEIRQMRQEMGAALRWIGRGKTIEAAAVLQHRLNGTDWQADEPRAHPAPDQHRTTRSGHPRETIAGTPTAQQRADAESARTTLALPVPEGASRAVIAENDGTLTLRVCTGGTDWIATGRAHLADCASLLGEYGWQSTELEPDHGVRATITPPPRTTA